VDPDGVEFQRKSRSRFEAIRAAAYDGDAHFKAEAARQYGVIGYLGREIWSQYDERERGRSQAEKQLEEQRLEEERQQATQQRHSSPEEPPLELQRDQILEAKQRGSAYSESIRAAGAMHLEVRYLHKLSLCYSHADGLREHRV